MKKLLFISSFLFLISSIIFAQPQNSIEVYFENAGSRYNIPVDLLKSISYCESRFEQSIGSENHKHHNLPRSFGLMGLRDDDWFGHSLVIASELIGKNKEELISNPEYNVMGAAAYLDFLAGNVKLNRDNINNWKGVLETFSGIPQDDVKDYFSYEILNRLKLGCDLKNVVINPHSEIDLSIFRAEVRGIQSASSIKSDDYGPAVWDPSPNYSSGIQQKFAVVHMTEGGFAGSLSWLKNPAASASSHYLMRSSDGYLVQLVREANKAWHAVCWNSYMLGVEHEGYGSDISWFTDNMYVESSKLFRHFCQKFSIPMDRNRVVGHGEWQSTTWKNWVVSQGYPSTFGTCNSHTDPGVNWDWNFYMQLITQDSSKPIVSSYIPANPSDSIYTNGKIKVTFNQRMKKAETQAAFSITPSVPGIFSWENLGKTLVFSPSQLFATGTTYTVRINNSAVNFINLPLNNIHQFNFTTKSYSVLNVNNTYPGNNQNNIPVRTELIIEFSAPVMQSSINGNIILKDVKTNSLIPISKIAYVDTLNKYYLKINTSNPLNYQKEYELTVKSGIKNVLGASLGDDYIIKFQTGYNNFISGQIFDTFEAQNNWKDPGYSGSTIGTDPNKTKFTITNEQKIEGTNSGKITYTFLNTTGGVVRSFNAGKPSIGSDDTKRFGIWIYGDNSNNFLEFWFYYNSTSNSIVRVDTLNWAGWKFVEIPISKIGQTGDKLFHSVVISQNPSGSQFGVIYLDAAQTRNKTTLAIPDMVSPSNWGIVNKLPVVFEITSVQNAGLYQFQISRDENFTSVISSAEVADLKYEWSGSAMTDTIYWRVAAKNSDGTGNWSPVRGLVLIISGNDERYSYKSFSLSQNYPNPFNPLTNINYTIEKQSQVTLILYDVLGNKINTLVNEIKNPGNYRITIDANNLKLSSGTYFYELKSGSKRDIKKLVYLK